MSLGCLTNILPYVRRPSRYINHEWNSYLPPADLTTRVRICFCFPDLYELGASSLGIEILYHLLNQRDDVYAERAYLPEQDMLDWLHKNNLPIVSLETGTPLTEFDVVGFSIPYELCYTNVIEILSLAKIPIFSELRERSGYPLIIGGGPTVTANPEPVAEIFDLLALGESENIILRLNELLLAYKRDIRKPVPEWDEKTKNEWLLKATELDGVYVPKYYTFTYNTDGLIANRKNHVSVPAQITKQYVNLETTFFPAAQIVPYTETIHNRLNIEIARGCRWKCRFCQARVVYTPFRERTIDNILNLIATGVKSTGFDEISLSSLSDSDYSQIELLLEKIWILYGKSKLSLGIPSLRFDTLSPEMIARMSKFPPTTITLAPEAGTERLRYVIGKKITDKKIYDTLQTLVQNGYRLIKLYFMYGLPTETETDLDGIIFLVNRLRHLYPQLQVNVTLSPFVPKPQTPFQWVQQTNRQVLTEKYQRLKKALRAKVKWHNVNAAYLEGIFSRGDRRLSKVLVTAHLRGCLFDQWNDRLKIDRWDTAFQQTEIVPDFYLRAREENEILPWEHLSLTVNKDQLWREYLSSLNLTVDKNNLSNPQPFPTVNCENIKSTDGFNTNNTAVNVKGGKKNIFPSQDTELKEPSIVQIVRLRFVREAELRFLSHLEQTDLFRRIIRRAAMPVVYTQGFHPQPKIALGPAISVGYLSQAEYIDISLSRRMMVEEIISLINDKVPAGMKLVEAKSVLPFTPSLTAYLNVGEYYIPLNELQTDAVRIYRKINEFMAQKVFYVEKVKEGKIVPVECRQLVHTLKYTENKIGLFLRFTPTQNIKPELVVQKIFELPIEKIPELLICRVALYHETKDGTLYLP